MPVVVLFYREDGEIPALDWLIADRNPTARERCFVAIERLAQLGHEARRPLVENLGTGIYELRIRVGHQNYRILYFFHGRTAVVLTSSFTKEGDVPSAEIDLAVQRKHAFEADPEKHHAQFELEAEDGR